MGWFLAVVGLVGLIFGVLQMLKGKKMNAVPFRAPSQIAQLGQGAADARGLVSTEGTVGQQNLLVAPMSGRPCLAYELTIERKWEKSERTENGTQTKKGSSNILRDYKGATFALQDPTGAGQIWIDASEQPDAPFEKVHSSTMNVGLLGVIPGTLQFGGFQMNTPAIVALDSRTTGFEGTEKIVPPSPTLYALGQVMPTPQGPVLATPKGIGTGKLILSQKGRASLVTSTKRNMVLGYALGGVMFVGGSLLGILGPKPASAANACASVISDAVSCDSRMYERDGKDFTWTVTTAGVYGVSVKQPNVKAPVDATITITDASGEQIAYNDGGSPGAEAKVKRHFEPGIYTVNVRDFARDKVSGGYGFHLEIVKDAEATEPAAVAMTTTEPVGTAAVMNADVNLVDAKPVAKAAVKGAAASKATAAPKSGTKEAAPAKDAKEAAPAKGAKAKDTKEAAPAKDTKDKGAATDKK